MSQKDSMVAPENSGRVLTDPPSESSPSLSFETRPDTLIVPRVEDDEQPSFGTIRLCGREEQQLQLIEAYHQSRRYTESSSSSMPGRSSSEESTLAKQQSRSNIVLLKGETGVGKSCLAESLRDVVTNDGGFFVRGKFDRLQRREPYAAFVSAFTEFTAQVCAEGEASIQTMRQSIHQSIEAERKILVDMIPALKIILGEPSQVARSNAHGSEAIFRFIYVFRKFVKAVSSRPVVILLDDLHWADPCSFDLLASLVPDVQQNGVFFVATCHAEKVLSPDIQSLSRRLSAENTHLTEIAVPPLSVEDAAEMIASCLSMDRVDCLTLSHLLHDRTKGNALFTLEYLRIMRDEELLVYDTVDHRWTWTDLELDLSIDVENLSNLIVESIYQLPARVQEVLKVASCMGSVVDEHLLEYVLSVPVSDYMKIAVHSGLLSHDSNLDCFVFVHDEVQATAYALIANEMRSRFHVAIGRKLRRRLKAEELQKNRYIVLDQFHRAASELKDENEKYEIALLCLEAGAHSVNASTFRTAAYYFDFGIRLLSDDHWNNQYELSLALYNAAAEVQYCTGDLARVDALLNCVFEHGRCFRDKLQAYATKIYGLGTRNKLDEAIATGLFVLDKLGQPFAKKPGKMNVIYEVLRMKRLLHRKSDEAILRLPLVQDENSLSAMQFLNAIFLYSFMENPNLMALISLRIVCLTIKCGLSAFSSVGFAIYGIILTTTGEFEEAYRYGQLALELLEKFNANVWLPRVYAGVFGCIHEFTRPFEEVLEPLKRAYHIGLETGDIEYALVDGSLYCFHLFVAGKPLPLIESELNSLLSTMKSHKQEARQVMISSFLRKIHCLMGKHNKRVSFTGDAPDLETALRARIESETTSVTDAFWSHFNDMEVSYTFGDYKAAVSHGDFCRDVSKVSRSGLDLAFVYRLDGLSLLALYRESGSRRRRTLAIVRHHTRQIRKFAQKSPHNMLMSLYLLEAELESVQGQNERANCKFTSAIAMAVETGHLHGEAMACERAGLHSARIGNEARAKSYICRAASSYSRWGSEPKARQLREQFPNMF